MKNVEDDNEGGKKVFPKSFLGQKCFVKAAILFDGIFINSQTISLQVKVWEANVTKIENTFERLLSKVEPSSTNGDSVNEEEEDVYVVSSSSDED